MKKLATYLLQIALLLFALIISLSGLSQTTQITVAGEPQDYVICGKTYKKIIELYSGNILAFEKYSEKYRVWQTPVLIVKDGPTIYLEETENKDVYYYGDFAPSDSRKFIYMGKYYTTLELPKSNNEILKFHSSIIIDCQTGKELLSLYGTDVMGEWNSNDEWVSGEQILFSTLHAQEKQYQIRPKALDVGVYDYSKVKKNQYKVYYDDEAEKEFEERLMLDERLKSVNAFGEYIKRDDGSTIYFREQEACEYCPELEYVIITGGHGFISAYDLRTLEAIFVNPSSYVYSPSGKYRFGTFQYDGREYYIEVKEGDKYIPYLLFYGNEGDMSGVYWVDDETIHYLSKKERADGSIYQIGYSTKFYEVNNHE